MDKLPRMTEQQFRRAKKLIRRLCANCDGDNCLLLDDGEPCPCPQMVSYTLICRYFRAAVLPADQELYAEVMDAGRSRRCISCGSAFIPTGSRSVYCKKCARIREKRRKMIWARKYRTERRRLGSQKP